MPAHQIENEDPSEYSSSSDESSSAASRFAIVHEPDLEIESSPDPSSEELGIISNLSSNVPDQISRSSSVSRSTSRSLSNSAHSQIPNTSEGAASITEWGPPNLRRLTSIRSSQLRYPKSQYCNYVPPLPICYEEYAVNDLLEAHAKQKLAGSEPYGATSLKQDFLEFELSEFVVYLPDNRHHPFEIWSLQDLASKNSCSTLLFDGILRVGDVRRYVQAVPFDICSVGNYGEDIHDVGDNIWIRSTLLAKSDIYYRLKSPAPEYARFYQGFLWLANLAKHFVDYCQWSVDKRMQVSVFNFRTKFSHWLQRKHGMSSSFQSWYKTYINDDFRHAVAANIHFLFKESIGIDDKLRNLTIWNELLEKDIVPVQKLKESMTIVTPYVYDCFKHLRFGHLLKSVVPKFPEQKPNNLHIKAHFLPAVRVPHERMSEPLTWPSDISKSHSVESRDTSPWDKRGPNGRAIRVGDVLSVTKDGENSVWKDEATQWKAADVCWYLYVQGVYKSKNGKQSFAGLWLYKSSDTCCAKMKYPYPNELFLSDNCTCSHGRIQEDEVLDKVAVEWHGSPSTSRQSFFVRQTYLENEKFESLKEEHKTCEHLKRREKSVAQTQKFPIGQTVLVRPPEQKPKHALEPYEIITYIEDGTKRLVVLKHLLRRNEIAGQAGHRPNELVYSGRTHQVDIKRIECTCLVRFYSEADVKGHTIPTPYDRDGTGNAFYITTRLIEHDGSQILEPIENDLPRTLIQGFDPTELSPHKSLRGLDLYCGGGNFGRGLEEGGALHNEWAVDYAKTPMHSYYANLKEPSGTKLFCGSVDDQLYQALCGNPKQSDLIPLPGEVDFISAGSPCQGFSALNSVRNNNKGLKNQSLVASVAAYIDFYRPRYGLLENVMTMAQKGLGRDEDVLSQLICAIVGMGYQLQLFVLDAWSLGSPQSRSRLFVSFAAPGYSPLEHPQLSHSHPANIKSRGLGKLANGQSFGHRIHCPTPFEYVTASDATTDLSDIGDGQTYQCTPFPDHIMATKPSTDLRSQMAVIPTYPQGSSFVSAWKEGNGVMTKEQRALFPSSTSTGKTRQCVQKTSKAWGRVHPRRLFPTIVVRIYPMDARMGTCLHWEQQRILTVMEARRAQGFPDHEVLVGSAADKWKVIGNSVPRTVSLALGLSLRNAWLKSPSYQEPSTVEIETRFTLPATKTNVNEISRAQLSQLQKETILRSHDNISNESNVVRHLGPRPLVSTTRFFRRNKTITTSNARPGRISPVGQPENIQRKTRAIAAGNSLKRQHSSIQEASILTAEKRHKTLKLSALGPDSSSPSTESSHERAESRYLTGHFTNPSGHPKRSDVFFNRVAVQRRESLEERRLIISNSETESIDEDEKDEEGTMNSVVSRMTQSGINGTKRLSSGESQCHIFIDLDTDTEDNTSPDSVVSGQNIIRSPQPKFVHTHNDKAERLQQTNQIVNRDRRSPE